MHATSTTSPLDVIIAGAGPVGLFLACELGLAGLRVLVLEAADGPATPLKRLPFGMRGLSSPTIEALHRRGLLEAVSAQRALHHPAAATAHWTGQSREPGGHFAGIQFYRDQVDPGLWPYRLDDPVHPVGVSMASEMAHLESVLAARATALGVEIRRGVAVTGVQQSDAPDHRVQVHTAQGSLETPWLVGCDGGRSAVRKACGFGFTGTAPEFTGYSALVELADPQALPAGRHHTAGGMYTYQPPGILAMADFDGGACHRAGPLTVQHVEAVLRRVSGLPVTVKALTLAATWTDRACQAGQYRKGGVLLAGDAAHVHSPLGGQGLNLGLGDAMNLGWKLAATVRGDAPPGLLDTYFDERHPVGAQVLDWSRAQVALMRPERGARALEAVMRQLIGTRDGAAYVAGRVWGLALRYELGGGHTLCGRSAPDIAFSDGTRLGQRLRGGRGLMVEIGADAALRTWAGRWNERIGYAAGAVGQTFGLGAMLVRPDGIVAWAIDGGAIDVNHEEALEHAATRWFGAPARKAQRG